MGLSASLGKDSHTEGRCSPAHKLDLITRSWPCKGRSKSEDRMVFGTAGPVSICAPDYNQACVLTMAAKLLTIQCDVLQTASWAMLVWKTPPNRKKLLKLIG